MAAPGLPEREAVDPAAAGSVGDPAPDPDRVGAIECGATGHRACGRSPAPRGRDRGGVDGTHVDARTQSTGAARRSRARPAAPRRPSLALLAACRPRLVGDPCPATWPPPTSTTPADPDDRRRARRPGARAGRAVRDALARDLRRDRRRRRVERGARPSRALPPPERAEGGRLGTGRRRGRHGQRHPRRAPRGALASRSAAARGRQPARAAGRPDPSRVARTSSGPRRPACLDADRPVPGSSRARARARRGGRGRAARARCRARPARVRAGHGREPRP